MKGRSIIAAPDELRASPVAKLVTWYWPGDGIVTSHFWPKNALSYGCSRMGAPSPASSPGGATSRHRPLMRLQILYKVDGSKFRYTVTTRVQLSSPMPGQDENPSVPSAPPAALQRSLHRTSGPSGFVYGLFV